VKRVTDKLVLLFALGAIALNFPVLAIFNRQTTLAGIPVLYVCLFAVWFAVIASIWVLARARWDDED
jgi:hypothetical protein